jgi:hypothetical protein
MAVGERWPVVVMRVVVDEIDFSFRKLRRADLLRADPQRVGWPKAPTAWHRDPRQAAISKR